MDVALTVVFYTSVVGGLLMWIVATRASALTARWLFFGAAFLLAIAGMLGIFSIGAFFFVLAALCLASAARISRPPSVQDC